MKFSTFAVTVTALLSPATATACTFRLKVANSPNTSLNGLYVQSLDNIGTLGPPFTNITATIAGSTLLSTGVPGDGTGEVMLAPSLGVERIVFADVPPAGARYTEWALQSAAGGDKLTYGKGPDRFVVYSPGAPIAHYEIYWVPSGVMFGGWEVDLVAECIEVNVPGCRI